METTGYAGGFIGAKTATDVMPVRDCLSAHLETLAKNVSTLENEIGDLTQALTPVSKPQPPAGNKDGGVPAPIRSQASDAVVSQTERIKRLIGADPLHARIARPVKGNPMTTLAELLKDDVPYEHKTPIKGYSRALFETGRTLAYAVSGTEAPTHEPGSPEAIADCRKRSREAIIAARHHLDTLHERIALREPEDVIPADVEDPIY